jgi:hypothetical protein
MQKYLKKGQFFSVFLQPSGILNNNKIGGVRRGICKSDCTFLQFLTEKCHFLKTPFLLKK